MKKKKSPTQKSKPMFKSTTHMKNVQVNPDGQVFLTPSDEKIDSASLKEEFERGTTLSDSVLPGQFTVSNEFLISSNLLSVFEKYESRYEYTYVEDRDFMSPEQNESCTSDPEINSTESL